MLVGCRRMRVAWWGFGPRLLLLLGLPVSLRVVWRFVAVVVVVGM